MPLTIPEYITVKTAAGVVAAYLSPEADGLKDAWVDRELNGRCTLTLSLPLTSLKWQYLTDSYRIYAPDITGQMREFIILNPDAIERTREGRKIWGKITAHESWVRLGKDYVDPAGISNDPQTPTPPALAVVIVSGGSDLSGGLYTVGSAGHALYAVLQGTGWTVGTVDVTGTNDLETDKISVLANIQKIQEIWGGYLVWDSVAKTVSLRDETTWAVYTGYQIRYAKNEKSITRTDDYDIVTKLYPFGENDLNIGSVNGGTIYLTNNSYTAEVLEGIWTNQDLADAQKVKDEATKYLAKVCKPRHNYRAKHSDLRLLPGYQHEDYDLGHLVDLIDTELMADDKARIISYKFNVFQPWDPDLEVGDPIEKIESMLNDSRAMVQYLNAIKTSRGQITAYKLVDESLIKGKIAAAAVDATKLNTKTVILMSDTWTDNSPAPGSVAWSQHNLYYAGTEHVIVAGNTAQKYIYWDGVANSYSTSATEPVLADGQFIVVVNNGGLHDTVWDKGYAREFIGSAFIANAAILSAHIGLAQILDAHIASITANKITAGQLLTALVEIVGNSGRLKIDGDSIHAYNESDNEVATFAAYESLGTLVAAFTRASTAYSSGGTMVASGVPRYETVGGRLGFMIEEGTTNLLTANQASVGTDLTGITSNYGVSPLVTLTRDTTTAWSGSASAKLVNDYAGTQSINIETSLSRTPISPNTSYAFSVKIAASVAGKNLVPYICWYDAGGAYISQSAGTAVSSATDFQTISLVATSPANAVSCYVRADMQNAAQNDAMWWDGAQLEQKLYPTSWQLPGTARAAESMTVPTAGVFTKGDWAVDIGFTLLNNLTVFLFEIYIDANNYYMLQIDSGVWQFDIASGGVNKRITGGSLSLNTPYFVTISGDGSVMRLLVNGVQIGSDVVYTEPVGSLPANMLIGYYHTNNYYTNGIIYDLRVSSRARTLAEHVAAYNTGLPLSCDDATTLLMSMDGTLQPTVRKFGLWVGNGEVNSTVIKGSNIYGTSLQTGDEGATEYIELATPDMLRVFYGGNLALKIQANADTGRIRFYEAGAEKGSIVARQDIDGSSMFALASSNSYPIGLVGPNSNYIYLAASGNIYLKAAGTTPTVYCTGDFRMGSSGTKYNEEETVNYGKRLLAVRESPEQKYIDEGKTALINGECTIRVDPIFLECIERDTDASPWIVKLTPYDDVSLFVSEIGADYFIVKERNGGTSNAVFVWSLSVTRKDHVCDRLPEVV